LAPNSSAAPAASCRWWDSSTAHRSTAPQLKTAHNKHSQLGPCNAHHRRQETKCGVLVSGIRCVCPGWVTPSSTTPQVCMHSWLPAGIQAEAVEMQSKRCTQSELRHVILVDTAAVTLLAASKYSRLFSGSATIVLSPGFQLAGHTWTQHSTAWHSTACRQALA
jgi:hypothetical protein